jgi:trans-aconitate methyltransferase
MSFISDLFASSDHPNSIGAKFRSKRQVVFEAFFFDIFSKNEPVRILDLGGTAYFWENSTIPNLPNVSITLLNLHLESTEHPNITAMTGNATELTDFKLNDFDLVFSNSVIEHLYTHENQQKMAREIMRVGKYFFVQTPNKYFPIEAHYALPFAQFYPKNITYFLLTKTKLSRLKNWKSADARQYLEEIRLLDEKGMLELFPRASIYQEKFMGLVKSISAHNLKL